MLALHPYATPILYKQPASIRCRHCKTYKPLSTYRAEFVRGKVAYRYTCRDCECLTQKPRNNAKPPSWRKAKRIVPKLFKSWTGPAHRPFVGFCLIDARGLVNLTTLDQEDMTCASNAR